MSMLALLNENERAPESDLPEAGSPCEKQVQRKSKHVSRRGHMGNGVPSRRRDRFSISRF